MSYIALQDYSKQWIFRHKDLPLASEDLSAIKPMTPERSLQLWQAQVSPQSLDYSFFQPDDWAGNSKSWLETGPWQSAWDSNDNDLPELMREHFDWEQNTVVYVCYDSENVIETTWGVFQRAWKNFLFMDDGTLIIGRKRKQVAQFFDNGQMRIGLKP
ncbi:DUF2947 domain-containing protein [Oceanospirillum maris]|jgi:hypothetical protein|uniref:DUF2947 domain-containing protein n=1 Tax=Oceanospirillum maris TaxID=64977 RepID=UPI000404128B|nr:DUF2947 domain-containing protein [Oceanospirillum maris]